MRQKATRVIPVVADRACDSDTHRDQLQSRGWDVVCPYRLILVRHEFCSDSFVFAAFIKLACLLSLLKRF
ncbi:MAG: hypothetical protein DWH81_15025 [Planctomycetota bacterium]|nr:MAG: hypothetical protein DWH81_15025 [Planctomycetota bacterium]